MGDTVKASRSAPLGVTPGDFENLVTVSYNYDTDNDAEDVAAYMKLVKDNSCIQFGSPAEVSITKNVNEDEEEEEPTVSEPTVSVMDTESSSNTVVLSTAAVVA